MKIAILQQNFLVGDLEGNYQKILRGYKEARDNGAELVVSTELALFGYPPKDMLLNPDYLQMQDKYLADLYTQVGDTGLIVGIAEKNNEDGKPLFNSVVLTRGGKVESTRRKTLLPTYDVFDEQRYFEPGSEGAQVFDYKGKRMAILVCEDIWGGTEIVGGHRLYKHDPVKALEGKDLDILIVSNGSPYYWGKGNDRFELVTSIAEKLNCSVVYANQVGGNDDLVFDGRSFVISPDKKCIGAAESFKEAILMVDLGAESLEAKYPFDKDVLSELYNALVLGTRDYVKKSKNDAGVVALSGGIDSAVVACIAADALGARNVSGVGMPSGFSSQGSVDDAKKLAENLGIAFHLIKIQDIYDFVGSALKDVIGWNVPGDIAGDVTEENVQARVRGILVMAMTNRVGPKKTLLISTGNKSEVAMGYCTLYGDTAGGFAPLSDVYKTDVYRLANYINRDSERIPQNTISKAPSAELRPDQKDEDSLPPYSVLDPTLKESIECQGSLSDMAQHGLSIEKVQEIQQTLNRNEFKRRQMPPGLKVTSKAFGTGRRWPIAAKFL